MIKRKYLLKTTLIICALIALSSCASKPPSNINNACSIIHEYPDWYYDMLDSYNRWGVPLNIQMAFIRQESSFRDGAKPPMQYWMGFIPVGRASSAYGYAQALDGTWDHYKKETKQSFVSRSSFSDSVDFIGWYLNNVHNKTGISKTDAYNLYLAYHEGIGGYKKGSHRNNSFLLNYAKKTAGVASKYSAQLKNCPVPRKPILSYIF
ncbi:transglycosylase SLT domain-containing protein [Pseudofrancisella aestuarii]|uniref:Transglycosylase SLT domain-containing protein n=1 Tax=Pseudofrancisella aestuarii TaxID=2670347 RepID=A0ABV9TCJ1_9GAMM|nr:transglycosylase SLT domain-containing protein [Pseudofrancisella aestuarii]